jgi:hypothetical protein
MEQPTREIVRAAQESVQRLVTECRKEGPLYKKRPKIVAQVSRTGKWLLNAITTLNQSIQNKS